MGGRGTSGARNSGGSIQSQVDSFLTELEDRQYGTGNKPVPEKQKKEYRAAKREISSYLEDSDYETIIPASGFAMGNDDYVHTTAKLNSYQRLVRKDAKDLKLDLDLGVVKEAQAQKELRVLKSLDKTIKDRRK